MLYATIFSLLSLLLLLAIAAGLVYLFILVVRVLKTYISSKEVRKEKAQTCKSLGESIRDHRIQCKMTQEFVAEHLGVSRQAVSKWENGTCDPSTSNLLALAKLFGIPAKELLQEIQD